MRVTFLCVGSRGDVEPYAALAAGLKAAGHTVRVATHPRYHWLVAAGGVEAVPLAEGELSRGAETPAGRTWLQDQSSREPTWVGILRDGWSVARQRLNDCRDAATDTDAVLASPLATLLGYQVAEDMHLPLLRVYYAPLTPLAPDSRLAATPVLRPLDAVRQTAIRQMLWTAGRPWVNGNRRRLRLPPLSRVDPVRHLDRQRLPVLYGYSPEVFPRRPDWGRHVHVTGYWFHDRLITGPMPAELEAFLQAGPPPVVVRLDSIAGPAAGAVAPLVLSGRRRAGLRAVLLTGRISLSDLSLPPSVLALEDVPLGAVLTRASAVVHHGGAGSTAAGIRAGVPTVVVWGFGDQAFWGRCIRRLGVGPPAIAQKQLSAERLAAALHAVTTDAGMRRRANALARRVRAEDGVACAVEAFEREVARLGLPT